MKKIVFVLGCVLLAPVLILGSNPAYGKKAKSKPKVDQSQVAEISPVKENQDTASPITMPESAADTPLSSQAMTISAKEIPVDDASFREMLTAAYGSSPNLGAAEYQSKSANEDIMRAKAGWGPELKLKTAYDINFNHDVWEGDIPGGQGVPALPPSYRQYTHTGTTSAAAVLEQNLYAGGATTAGIEAAKSQALGSQAGYSRGQQTVLLKAAKAHLDVAKSKAIQELRTGNVAALQKRLDVAKARFEFGDLTLADVASTEAKLDKARSELTATIAELESAKAVYRQEIGRNAPEILSVPSVPTFLPESREKALEITLQNNPILKQMDADVSVTKARLDGSYASLKPKVDLTANASRRLDTNWNANAARGTHRDRRNAFAAGASVTLPLDIMGAAQSQIRKAKYESALKRISSIYQRQDVLAKATKAWETYKALESNIQDLQSQVKAAKIAQDTLTEGYLVGNNTTLEVLTAEQEYFSAQVELTRTKLEFLLKSFELAEAIGILTPENLGLNVRSFDGQKHYEDISRWGVGVDYDQTEYSGEALLDLP